MGFGQNKCVTRINMPNIQNGHDVVVLMDDMGRNLLVNNFAEYAIVHDTPFVTPIQIPLNYTSPSPDTIGADCHLMHCRRSNAFWGLSGPNMEGPYKRVGIIISEQKSDFGTGVTRIY